jgi:hypothetical protein
MDTRITPTEGALVCALVVRNGQNDEKRFLGKLEMTVMVE